jgi:hypothetical protein
MDYEHEYVLTAGTFSRGENITVWRREDVRAA